MNTARWSRALVTGASSGIGLAFAELLAAEGADLVVVARNRERLDSLASRLPVEVEVLPADLSDRDQLSAVEERVRSATEPVDLLVNNAGFGSVGDFVELPVGGETSVVEVNVTAVHRLAHAAGSAMAGRGAGGILNVSSVAGYFPTPRSATYGASKAFVTSLSEALHAELGPQGVVVTCLCPGLTRTEFHERANYDSSRYPAPAWQTAERVAAAGLAGLAAGKPVVVPGAHNKLLRSAVRLAPQRLVRRANTLIDRRQSRQLDDGGAARQG